MFSQDKAKTFYDVVDTEDPMPFLFELQQRALRKNHDKMPRSKES